VAKGGQLLTAWLYHVGWGRRVKENARW